MICYRVLFWLNLNRKNAGSLNRNYWINLIWIHLTFVDVGDCYAGCTFHTHSTAHAGIDWFSNFSFHGLIIDKRIVFVSILFPVWSRWFADLPLNDRRLGKSCNTPYWGISVDWTTWSPLMCSTNIWNTLSKIQRWILLFISDKSTEVGFDVHLSQINVLYYRFSHCCHIVVGAFISVCLEQIIIIIIITIETFI